MQRDQILMECTDLRNDDKTTTTRHAVGILRIICSIVILYFTRVHDDINEGSFICKLDRRGYCYYYRGRRVIMQRAITWHKFAIVTYCHKSRNRFYMESIVWSRMSNRILYFVFNCPPYEILLAKWPEHSARWN